MPQTAFLILFIRSKWSSLLDLFILSFSHFLILNIVANRHTISPSPRKIQETISFSLKKEEPPAPQRRRRRKSPSPQKKGEGGSPSPRRRRRRSPFLLEEGEEGYLLLLEGGEVLEGSRLLARGTTAPQPSRPTTSEEPAKGGTLASFASTVVRPSTCPPLHRFS